MDSTQKRLSAAAWSLLESLSRLRKSVQRELDFLNTISPHLSPNRLENALEDIDDFSTEISDFIADIQRYEADELEARFEDLATRCDDLKREVKSFVHK